MREQITSCGMMQDHARGISIPVWMFGYSEVGNGGTCTRKTRPNEGEKVFCATALNLFPNPCFFPWAFLVGTIPPFLSSSRTRSKFHLSAKMRFSITQVLAAVLAAISAVNAHMNVVYPALRGPNVSKNQVLFCGE